jgi:class 3 adenylate cyclase
MSIAKRRMPVNAFAGFDKDYGVGTESRLNSIYDGVAAAEANQLLSQGVALKIENDVKAHQMIATFFREGTLFTYAPVDERETILDLLARRERVIRDLLKNRQPFRTDLCILSASLEGEAQLKSEMAPESYFALMNDVWMQMDPILRKFHGVHGNHSDHGLLYYFFPQPDSNFAWNSAACAIAMREEVAEIARSWRGKLSWLPEIHMNIGLEQGRDWFGTIKSSAQYQFAVLGETSKTAETLCRLATAGQILGTKNVIAELDHRSKDDLQFGITRHDLSDRNFFIPESYSRVRNFVDLTSNVDPDLAQLSDLAICEIRDIGQSNETTSPNQAEIHSTN